MTSLHHRSASGRVNSTRIRDYDGPRDNGSPVLPDNLASSQADRNGHSPDRVVERRREKNTIVTKEKFTTRRSPQKETARSYGRDDSDRQRRDVESPVLRRRQKEEVPGM
jgi:hypothetical protein